ncbi:putative 5'-nucleotidase [Glarea lozoyensis 74030]|uniref:Putative 5'-nucleotidase n=1 Tax=Glarea lozoyensis (strain ATCC 74030 / MF5533) TaxID=1104152 RepID=H0ERI1_GLAL7|nr:putative 5'-nucleotidase [Glarea lozoyensis 74030]
MKFSQSLVSAGLLVGASSLVAAEDVLVSKRMGKRFIDDQGNYNISFYHINDVHAHLDEFRSSGVDCPDPTKGCFGGYARVSQMLKDTRPGHPDSLFLNVGDEFQGTLFYSYYGGEKIAETLNQLGFDGMTLGNHEFDGGDDKLGAFLQNLTFPIISANIVSDHPVLNATIKPYHIYEEYGLAVIGVTTDTTPSISSPGPNTKFTNVVSAVQNTINHIKSTTNITRIAAITHIGYDEDKKLAAAVSGLQLIMGGHSHTPLGDFAGAVGKYPTIATNLDGDEVFIVTAYRWGKILAYHGAPIHLDNTTAQDLALQAQIKKWREPFEAFAAEVVGFSNVVLDQTTCQQKECLLGDFMTDAMLAYRQPQNPSVAFALINAGGIRATIDEGNITRGEVLTSFPFGNAIVEINISGQELWKTLEGAVSKVNQFNGAAVTSAIQVSKGVNITFNPRNAVGSRLVSVDLFDGPLSFTKNYTVITLDFLAGGM